jgi:hypothetical protein
MPKVIIQSFMNASFRWHGVCSNLRTMRRFFVLVLVAFPLVALGAERPVEIDPNTKIQGGADVSGSGANAGAGAKTDNKIETDKSAVGTPSETRGEERGNVAGPEKSGPDKDKPISERKPQEREPEDAAKGGSATPQQ